MKISKRKEKERIRQRLQNTSYESIELIFTSCNTFNYIERNILGNSIDIKYNGFYFVTLFSFIKYLENLSNIFQLRMDYILLNHDQQYLKIYYNYLPLFANDISKLSFSPSKSINFPHFTPRRATLQLLATQSSTVSIPSTASGSSSS